MNTKPRAARTAREVAVEVLQRVTDEGAFAAVALDAELSRARLEARDAALATEIVYGTLRTWPALDRAIAPLLKQDPARMDALVRAALRSAVYQLLHLTRVPAYAVLDETVRLVRVRRGARSSGFVNALLRRLSAARPEAPGAASRLELPDWLRSQLGASLGPERLEKMVQTQSFTPAIGLRVRAGTEHRQALAERIAAARPEARVELGALSERALLVWRAGDPRTLPGHAEGEFSVQEEGAQAVAASLGVRAGERIADLCAGHGGKSLLFAEQLGDAGRVLAIDIDERKLERIDKERRRLGLPEGQIETRAIDLAVGVGSLAASFDRVMVDAPCTGLGTLQRRPELLLRRQPDDAPRLARLQLAIMERAAELVRPGGRLAFAVCSPLDVEGVEVARALEARVPGLTRVAPDGGFAEAADADGVLRIGAWSAPDSASSPDAYQVVQWLRG
jgi:16S rRNA (cytosine967-C5)-methyltransferase